MSNWNLGQPILMSAAGITGAASDRTLPPEWRRWIAANVLLRKDLNLVVEALLKNGFDRDTVLREIQAVQTHPYIEAARAAAPALAGGTSPAGADSKIKKRDWVLEVYRRLARQATSYGKVPRVRRPSRLEFLDRYYARNEPVVIEGAIADWPALKRWTPDYFKQRFGDRLVEVQANRNADPEYEINSNKHKNEMRFGDFVDLVESAAPTNDWYITANNDGKNRENLKELWEDIVQVHEYLRDDPGRRGFFWYGPRGTVTPLHHDLTNNFMAMVRGRKLVRLIAPYELADVYNHRHCFSQVDLDRVDLEKYPQFRNVKVIDVVLNPGDLFFLPVGWWHYVRGLDVTVTMTFTNFAFENDFYEFYTTYGEI
jgi:hypothetical protein